MYNNLSNFADKADVNGVGWMAALADAQTRYEQAKAEDKQRWIIVMGIIKQAIKRGEPWPEREPNRD